MWSWPDFSFISRFDDERWQKIIIILIGSVLIVFVLFILPYLWKSSHVWLDKRFNGTPAAAEEESRPASSLPAEPKTDWAVSEHNLQKLEQGLQQSQRLLAEKSGKTYKPLENPPVALVPPLRRSDWRESGTRLHALDQRLKQVLQPYVSAAPAAQIQAQAHPPETQADFSWRQLGGQVLALEKMRYALSAKPDDPPDAIKPETDTVQ